MKRLAACALALALLGGIEQRASAWCNFKFGVGLNLEFSSGNNNLLWGLHKNGQVPEGYGYGPGPMAPFYAPPPAYAMPHAAAYPAPQAAPAQAAYAGYYPQNYAGYNYAGYYPNNGYLPSSYYQLANYPSTYGTNYYLMSYPSSGINFYGN